MATTRQQRLQRVAELHKNDHWHQGIWQRRHSNASCLYGSAHRRSWRTGKEYSHLRKAEGPGDVVSVDQLVSSVPGFIAQEQGNVRYKLTRRRFKAATVFVDHFSRLSYVHIHTSTGGDEAVQAKEAFEAYDAQRGVYVKHYHGDNGIFKSDMSNWVILGKINPSAQLWQWILHMEASIWL